MQVTGFAQVIGYAARFDQSTRTATVDPAGVPVVPPKSPAGATRNCETFELDNPVMAEIL